MRMPGYGSVTPPEGYLRRLETHPGLSIERAEPTVLPEGHGWWDVVDATHKDIHSRFRYVPDAPGADTWEMPRLARIWMRLSRRWIAKWHGDCEDFCILMRRVLKAQGVPVGALRIATCEITHPSGRTEGHAVLTIEFGDRTVVSDVRFRYALRHDSPAFRGYRWIARQVPDREAWEHITAPTLADIAERSTP